MRQAAASGETGRCDLNGVKMTGEAGMPAPAANYDCLVHYWQCKYMRQRLAAGLTGRKSPPHDE
jgi:hypothetical protein